MICTDVQVYCSNGRRLLPDNENDIRMLLKEPQNLTHISCISEEANLEAEFDMEGAVFITVINNATGKAYCIDNGSGNEKPVELMINPCPAGKLMCYNKEEAADIILYFCNTGGMHPEHNWIQKK